MKNEETVVSRRTATVALRLCSVGRMAPQAGQESTVQESGGHRPPLQKTAARQHGPTMLVPACNPLRPKSNLHHEFKPDSGQFKPNLNRFKPKKNATRNTSRSHQGYVPFRTAMPGHASLCQRFPEKIIALIKPKKPQFIGKYAKVAAPRAIQNMQFVCGAPGY